MLGTDLGGARMRVGIGVGLGAGGSADLAVGVLGFLRGVGEVTAKVGLLLF
jgi:hypothetical protein